MLSSEQLVAFLALDPTGTDVSHLSNEPLLSLVSSKNGLKRVCDFGLVLRSDDDKLIREAQSKSQSQSQSQSQSHVTCHIKA